MPSVRCISFVCGAVLLAGAVVSAAVDAALPEEALVSALKLGSEYNSAMRAPPDNGTANTLNVFVYLFSLVNVNSASQEVTVQIWLEKGWLDSRLAWFRRFNSSFDNIEQLILPPSQVWRPDLAFNRVIELKDIALDPSPVLVMSNGSVTHGLELLVTFKCRMQMFNFPFDTQTCKLLFASRMQARNSMLLNVKTALGNGSPGNHLIQSNDFCVLQLQFRQKIIQEQDFVEFLIKFQRRPAFYVTNILMPSILLLAISAIAFCLPPECGERISFSITIVLSLCVFLQLAGNYTPMQSESVPLITWLLGAAVLLTMLTVFCNAFVLSCHFKQQSCSARVSNQLVRALFLNRLVTWRLPGVVASVGSGLQSQSKDTITRESEASLHDNEWAKVAKSADRVFLLVFLVSLTILLVNIVIVAMETESFGCIVGSAAMDS